MLAFSTHMAGKFWNEKEKYRCRLFDLTNGKEGSHLVQAPDIPAPPLPAKPSPTRPFTGYWLHNHYGEYFRREDVVAVLPNSEERSMDVVLSNGHTINTGLGIDDLKMVLGISFSCTIYEELAHIKEMNKMED